MENKGMSPSTALTILFIALKLLGFIEWSWLWVLSPAWIGVVIWLLGAMIVAVVATLRRD